MSLNDKKADDAAQQQIENNNSYFNNNNDLKDASFTPTTEVSTTPSSAKPLSAMTTPSSVLENPANNAENQTHPHNTSSSSFIHIPPPPPPTSSHTKSAIPTTNSESLRNSNSLSRRSLDVHTLDIHEPQQQQQEQQQYNNNKQQPSTPTLSTNSKINSTTHEYTSNNGVPHGHYRNTLPPQDDNFKLFTIFGNGEFPSLSISR